MFPDGWESGVDWSDPLQVAGAALAYLYQGMIWVADSTWASLWWLWVATPAGWSPLSRFGLASLYLTMIMVALSQGLRRRTWLWLAGLIFGRSTLFGSSRFANAAQIKAMGLFRPAGRFLGQHRERFRRTGRDLYLHGEGHSLTIAAPGSGKTTGVVIPTLLSYRGGPIVATDPKGAITAQTRRFHSSVGRVIVLNPWGEELKNDPTFGVDLGDDGFNPLQLVALDHEGMTAANTLAGLLLPDVSGEDPYWRLEGRRLLEWAMLALCMQPAAHRTLPRLHRLLFDYGGLLDLLKLVARSEMTGFGMETLQLGALHFAGIHKANPAQLAGIVGVTTTAISVFGGESRLAAHVSKDGFRLADLKTGAPFTLYLICPPDHLVSDDRKWLNLVLAVICQYIGRPGKAIETVLLMDEFPALGHLPNLPGALAQFRESGLRAHLFAQDAAQIEKHYGRTGLEVFWGLCGTKQFFRIDNPNTAKLVSDWIGPRTATQYTRNPKGEISESEVGVPLIRPNELLRMRSDRQVILRPEMDPMHAQVFRYFERPAWAELVDLNPYRQKS